MNASVIGIKANTFSICAVDPQTGEAGVAVASRCLAVGGLVCYARPGAGAIATQSFINPVYGPRGLDMLSKGVAAGEVVRRLTEDDFVVATEKSPESEEFIRHQMVDEGVDFARDKGRGTIIWFTNRIRQVGIVDRQGNAAVHTGERVDRWYGCITGPGFACQGNLLAGEKVISDMAEAFERARHQGLPMVRQLLSALQAGEAAGGDARGKQAAGMLVVRDRGNWTGSDNYCDLRVDDHEDPVTELARIIKKAKLDR